MTELSNEVAQLRTEALDIVASSSISNWEKDYASGNIRYAALMGTIIDELYLTGIDLPASFNNKWGIL